MDTGHHHGPGPWVVDLDAPRVEPDLLPPRGQAGHRLRSHRERQQRGRAVRARARARSTPIRARRRRNSCSGSTTCRGTGAMRSGRTLWAELVAHYDARCRRGRATCASAGSASRASVDARRYPRGRRAPRRAGGRGAVVARRLHRLFPLGERAADARRAPGAAAHRSRNTARAASPTPRAGATRDTTAS